MRLSLAVSLLAVFSGQLAEAKGGRGKKVGNASGGQSGPSLSNFERGRRKRKKVPPVKRFNYLVQKLGEFRREHVTDNHKKTNNKLGKFKAMLTQNLGTLKAPRSARCTKIEESDKYQRQQRQQERKAILQVERQERKAKVTERRERKLQERRLQEESGTISLFGNDVIERRKREENATTDYEWDYDYYYYGEGNDYEVYIGDYDDEFGDVYPDYEGVDSPGSGIQARGRRKKKKGRKAGPIKQFFNLNASIRKFIEDELKSCARKDVYVKRLGRLADNIKLNAPVLNKPPKKGKKGKKRGKKRG